MRLPPLFLLLLTAACSGGDRSNANDLAVADDGNEIAPGPEAKNVENAARNALPPLDPPEPGESGRLPDDRTPISEAPFTEESAQGAASVVQSYHALIESGRYDQAWRLW